MPVWTGDEWEEGSGRPNDRAVELEEVTPEPRSLHGDFHAMLGIANLN